MKKTDAIDVFGSASELARFLGISRQAVFLWGEEVPPLRVYQLKERRPGIENEIASRKAEHART